MLAGRFGVSPTPVREAILDLAKEGLVSIVKNKGFRVKALSERDLDEITQIRELLEIPVVADQTGRLSEPQVQELRRLADNIVSAAGRGDLVAYIESDNAFHLTLLRPPGINGWSRRLPTCAITPVCTASTRWWRVEGWSTPRTSISS
ncbi:GntR family transcriptional regulator [Micromonospora sp. BRA006-A]|nr:GntR family transcriptional regulator [Micromonospora sp. BRA006-A]